MGLISVAQRLSDVEADVCVADWPPPVDWAIGQVQRLTRAQRAPRQSPAAFTVAACSIAAAARDDASIFRAYGILHRVARCPTARHHSAVIIAAANCAPVLASLGTLPALEIAEWEIQRVWPAEPPFNGALELLMVARQALQVAMSDMRVRGELDWTGPCDAGGTLTPRAPIGGDRISRIPHPLRGKWPDIARMLTCWGLQPPEQGPEGMCVATPHAPRVVVTLA